MLRITEDQLYVAQYNFLRSGGIFLLSRTPSIKPLYFSVTMFNPVLVYFTGFFNLYDLQ